MRNEGENIGLFWQLVPLRPDIEKIPNIDRSLHTYFHEIEVKTKDYFRWTFTYIDWRNRIGLNDDHTSFSPPVGSDSRKPDFSMQVTMESGKMPNSQSYSMCKVLNETLTSRNANIIYWYQSISHKIIGLSLCIKVEAFIQSALTPFDCIRAGTVNASLSANALAVLHVRKRDGDRLDMGTPVLLAASCSRELFLLFPTV